MISLIADIADRIKIHFPDLEKIEGIGRRDKDGRILQQVGEMNEFKYSGIDDRSSNYFYIRHRESGQFTYEQTDEGRVATCERVKRVSGRFSLVIVTNKVNAYEFEDKATRALISLDQCSRPGVRDIDISIIETEIDSITVAARETPGDTVKDFDPKLNFYFVDFDVVFTKAEVTVPGPTASSGVTEFNEYSMLYDGIDEYIDYGTFVSSGVDFDSQMGGVGAAWTWSFWFKDIPAIGTVLICRFDDINGSRQLFRLLVDGSGFSQFFIGYTSGGTSYVGSTDLRSLTGWHNIIFVYDGTLPVLDRMEFYIDNIAEVITPVDFGGAGTIRTNGTVPFFIGAQQSSVTPPAGLFSAGYRDEFSFFNIALSPAQRAELYNGGKPNDLSQHSAAASLKFWDRQGDTGTYLIAVNEQGGTGGTVENMDPEDITTETP